MLVEVRQYLKPDGKIRTLTPTMPDKFQGPYDEMTAAGFWFETEILSAGMVSICVSNGEKDIDGKLFKNMANPDDDPLEILLLNARWRDEESE
jgi:hypothetical protein